jgi:hypothetical protein
MLFLSCPPWRTPNASPPWQPAFAALAISPRTQARGEWKPGGAKRIGFDAYATSKQAGLAAALAFARETPRLHFNAVEPGLNMTTGLGDANVFVRLLILLLIPLFRPFIKILSTPEKAARVTAIVTDASGHTGVYYDERGRPMRGSALVHDPKFQDRVVAETRGLLGSVHIDPSPPDPRTPSATNRPAL